MSISDYLRAVAKGWWIVVGAAIAGVCAAIAIIVTTPPTYAGSVTFFVNTTSVTNVSPLQGDQYAQQRVATYARLLSSDRLAKLVAADTRMDQSPRQIAASISGESPLNTVLLTATVHGTSHSDVSAVTNSVATQFVKMIRSIDPTVSLEVTSGPTVLSTPVSPRKTLDLSLGFLVGLALGASAAIVRQTLDTRVRSVATLTSATGTAVLGWIATDPAVRRGSILVDAATRSRRAEAFRKLRTNLQYLVTTGGGRVIVVTSSTYGEGKSATAANLATIFAEADRRTLLIDGDLRRPRIANLLAVPPSNGLAEVLTGRATFADAAQPCHVKRLAVLTSGALPPKPAELLGSTSMSDLLDELRLRFDVIIVDTPPVLPVTDAAIAANQADGALIVVRYGKTKLAHVNSAINALRSAGASVLGCVVNMAPAKSIGAPLAQQPPEPDQVFSLPERSSPQNAARTDQPTEQRPRQLLDDEIDN